ncbi:MAG: hypothetical protein NTY68_05510 [Candidatus Micrarchaeota archaeon]|nr:hypothetical protein [Candidatus Micrarchaeota archaeon]
MEIAMQRIKENANASNKKGLRAIGITIATIFGRNKSEPEGINGIDDLPRAYRNSLKGIEKLRLGERIRIYNDLLSRRFRELEKKKRRNMPRTEDHLETKDGIYGFLYDNYKSLIHEKMDMEKGQR